MDNKGPMGMLFDLSFTEFVTTRVIKLLFIIGIVFAAFGALGLLISGFANGVVTGILCLILAPVFFLLYVLFARIWCEMIIVVFRIAENTGKMVEQRQQ